MPIYEYDCQQCCKPFEELVMRDENVCCPECGSVNVDRKLSLCGFISSSKFVGSVGNSNCSGCAKNSCSGCSNTF